MATHDQWVLAVQNLPQITLEQISEQGTVTPWQPLDLASVVQAVVINESNLIQQVEQISAQIMYWGRLEALAKRVWEVREREYRVWRDKTILQIIDGSKVAQWVADAKVREHADYAKHYEQTEKAEEAYNAIRTIVEAFRTKALMLRTFVRREQEASQPRLGI